MDPEYANWARDIPGYLSTADCAKLPEIIRAEVMHIIEVGNPVGLVSLWEESKEVYAFGIVIDKEVRKSGYAKKAVAELCDYVRTKKSGRLLLAYTIEKWFNDVWGNEGWILMGCIPNYSMVSGVYAHMYCSFKMLR
jgi:GNAT superfamily N-acetyltransferase